MIIDAELNMTKKRYWDLDMNKENGVGVFKNLFTKADAYDDHLKNEFGCIDRLEE
jgi:serine protease Do